MNLIGLDIGTTTICGVLYSRNTSEILKVSNLNNAFITSLKGEYQQDPQAILQKVKTILDDLIEFSTAAIAGISLSSQMHGILYVDKDGQAVSSYYTWQNQRGLKTTGGISLEHELSSLLGQQVYTGYGIVTHYSLFREGTIPPSARYICNIGDYVCMKLTGGSIPVTDITLGSSMGICSLETGTKTKELEAIGTTFNSYLPEMVSTTTLLGNYSHIPVIQPLGDNQASFLGSVKDRDKSILLNYGTAGQISFFSEERETHSGLEMRPLGNEGYIHVAFSLCGGKSYALLARFFEETVSLFTPNQQVDPMRVMDEMSIDCTEESIDCMPLFLGKRDGKGEFGYFKNITEANFTPQHVLTAVVQGMAKELYQYYEGLSDTTKHRFSHLVGAGNGIRKNRHLQNAVSYKFGKPVSLVSHSEESCLGAIINAGKGTGIYSSYQEGAAEIVDYLNHDNR